MDVATLLSQTVPEILAAITGAPVKVKSSLESQLESESNGQSLTAMSGLRGDVSGMVAMRCSRQTAERLFEKVVDGYAQKNEDNVRDLMAEVLNLVIGQIKAGLLFRGKQVQHSIPSVFSDDGEPFTAFTLGSEPPLVLESEVGEFRIHFVPTDESFEV